MKQKLIILSNEKFYLDKNNFYCDNICEKTLPDGLNESFFIEIIARSTKEKRSHELKSKNLKLFNSLISYLINVQKKINEKKNKFLVLSISPYTFFATLLFIFSNQKPIIYLRSDGHQEYKSILGFYGPIIFGIMFKIVSKIAFFISCRKYFLKDNKGSIVYPSEINKKWLTENNPSNLNNLKLLYVGRMKVEKGIFSLIKILKKNEKKIQTSLVGATKDFIKKNNQENLNILEIENNENSLIKIYDDHSIFILPSFTEGHPMVLLEALARLRPVVVFKDIEHVVGDKKGIFVAERNEKNFFEKINYIRNNYENIQREMKTNKLATKEVFLNDMKKLILQIN